MRAERSWVLVALATSCTTVEPTPVDSPAGQAREEKVVESEHEEEQQLVVVGMVYEGGTRSCDQGGEVSWVNRFWAIGFSPIVHDESVGETIAALEGRVVMAEASLTTDAATLHGDDVPPRNPTMCPQMQMRSDWELWPKGIRSRRGDEPSVGTLRVRSVSPIEPLRARAKGDDVLFGVTNPFDSPIADAVLIAHYEGCYGKPGSTAQRRPLGTIETGAALDDIGVPAIDEQDGPRGRAHRLSAVRVRGSVDGGVIDLDVPVATLGVEVDCPKR